MTITPLSEKDAETFASYAYLDTNSSYFNLPIEIAIKNGHNDVNGYYGPKSEGAVQTFQNIFGLPVTGIIDETTFDLIWRVSSLYEIVLRVEII